MYSDHRLALTLGLLLLSAACEDRPAPLECEDGDIVGCSCADGRQGQRYCEATFCSCNGELDAGWTPGGGAVQATGGETGSGAMMGTGATMGGDAGSGGTMGGDAGTGGMGTGGMGGGGALAGYAMAGPMTAAADPAPPLGCSIYRPETLGDGGMTHPIVLWANRTGKTKADYEAALLHFASYGFIVAVAEAIDAGDGAQMLICFEAVRALGEGLGDYMGKVNASRVAAVGHSEGGAGAIMAGADARVMTAVPLQPRTGQGFILGFNQISIGQQKGPMLLLSGEADSVAPPMDDQQRVWDDVNQPTAWLTLTGGTHDLPTDLGDYRGVITAWLLAQLMDDSDAEAVFYGADCGVCDAAGWTVERKGLD